LLQAEKEYECALKGHIPEYWLTLTAGDADTQLTRYVCARCKKTVYVSASGVHALAGEEYGGK